MNIMGVISLPYPLTSCSSLLLNISTVFLSRRKVSLSWKFLSQSYSSHVPLFNLQDKILKTMSLKLNLIAAACENMGIGNKNDLPWRLRKEMAYFNRMTTETEKPGSGKINAVIMGRRTWESIPPKFRPLAGRLNVVLSSSADAESLEITENELLFPNWEEAMKGLESCQESRGIEKVWVIGGSSIYKLAIESPLCHRIYLTRIHKNFECDTFFPEFDKSKFQLVSDPHVPQEEQEEGGIRYQFQVYEKTS